MYYKHWTCKERVSNHRATLCSTLCISSAHQSAFKAVLCKADGHPGNALLLPVSQEELSDAKSMIEEISAKQEEMQQKIEQLQQEKRRESRKVKAK